jgi:DNA gyrase/topoisomerase IV subunit B
MTSSYSADQIQVLEGLEPVRNAQGCTSVLLALGDSII